ncbi:MAG: hypothetical protein E7191_05515 [Erysipelotrichaceae bacterium]|nr:hypothetical protein [Erysipelotrichaceae bacterium]
MDKKEKKARKERLSEHVNLGNGRFTDYEIEKLESLVQNRDKLDGTTKTCRFSYKTFDSKDTYRVDVEDTYTFRNAKNGMRIEQDVNKYWDDGQHDTDHKEYNTAREILNIVSKLFDKFGD